MKRLFQHLILPVLVLIIINLPVLSQEKSRQDLLTGSYNQQFLLENLLDVSDWHPYPAYGEIEEWSALVTEVSDAILASGENALEYAWPSLSAELYLQFARNGNRSNYQNVYFERRSNVADLVLAECVERQGRFTDQIINGIWVICEESSWCIPAHISAQKDGSTPLPIASESVVDLFAAETGSLLAWTYFIMKEELDKVTPVVSKRIEQEINRRILQPVMNRDDFWWMGTEGQKLNNWTPWIVSNWLACALIMENNPAMRAASIYKAMAVTDRFLNDYPNDGGCDEGPSYWGRAGGSLFDGLELLYLASGENINIYSKPLIKNIASYIYKAYIADDYYLNFADASARMSPDADLVYRFGQRINDPVMKGFGAFLSTRKSFKQVNSGYTMDRRLRKVFGYDELKKSNTSEPLILGFWFPDLQVMGARSKEGSRRGLYLAVKGGHNDESHNHNDVGNYVVYFDGKPVIIDIGVEEYTRKTFSNERYSIWTMQSGYHTLPTINGHMQKDGRDFNASKVSFRGYKGSASFTLDIAGAYPEEAGVKKWIRSIFFRRGRFIRIIEDYELKEVTGETYISYITPCMVQSGNGELVFEGEDYKVALEFDASKMKSVIEEIEVTDRRLIPSWGKTLRRVKLIITESTPSDQLIFTFKEKK